jgi:DNA-directed RNA polymerase subunit RPC12/RpoP
VWRRIKLQSIRYRHGWLDAGLRAPEPLPNPARSIVYFSEPSICLHEQLEKPAFGEAFGKRTVFKMSYCGPCDWHYPTPSALEQHRQTSDRHTYDCRRCQKPFKSHSARSQHILDSPKHNICVDCSVDFSTLDEWNEHAATEHNRCAACSRKFKTPDQLLQHEVDKHNMCETCLSYFDSPSNLRNVRFPKP